MAAAVGVAGLLALVGCGEPSGSVSSSGTNWTVTFDREFQNSIGEPVVWASVLCHGSSAWRTSPAYNVNNEGQPTLSISLYCPTGVASGSWGHRAS